MKKFFYFLFAFISLPFWMACSKEDSDITQLTEENYARAESQLIFQNYISRIAKATNTNGMGQFFHVKKPADPNDKTILRINFDTQYSYAILDLKEEATLTMPETNGRYQSAWFITDEHYNPLAINKPGTYQIKQEEIGARYVMIAIRTQTNMKDPEDMQQASALQDQIVLFQKDRGEYNPTDRWDEKQILAMRKKYQKIVVDKNITSDKMFGKKGTLTLENHNCGVAYGWGGLTPEQAVYLGYLPTSTEPQIITLKDVPIAPNAFWSITVYDDDGFVAGESFNINSSFAEKNIDGSTTIHFGGDKTAKNYVDIFPGWNFTLRMYLPTEDYFNGLWQKPSLKPIDKKRNIKS